MSYALIGLLIGLKFFELYSNRQKKENNIVTAANVEPPYKNTAVGKGICGICKQTWTNPTALTSSGYVFCYTCIKTSIQVFGVCPITKIKSNEKNLRKLHLN